jgi:hypothetical protein
MVDYRDLATVRQVAAEAPFITEAKLRWWVFHSDTNGLKAALIKIGGRVYIDRAEFNRWRKANDWPQPETDAAGHGVPMTSTEAPPKGGASFG